jgi:hypothetical protein
VKAAVWALSGFVLMAAIDAGLSPGQTPPGEPTRQEIAEVYRSKAGEGGTFIPSLRWERWRIREIRGWSLHFKRMSENRGPGILTREYRIIAKKNGLCSSYDITDTMPLPPVNSQIRPLLVVEPKGVNSCR